ncbi:hypothetical protein [Yoonia sp. I 8.24]|uniref:hypothetical protein n=1 Tax=Yoonia sp. I 8.24 TaxID=1537229 RepID=UPI001EE014C1|nr:hypothetical protein [Yoonia sp. I 8.24]MCG3267167.1 hypothetical protein [Yoonia sp. I 8.24]
MADPRRAFNRITNPDGTPVRDKDNTQPVLKPAAQNLRPAQNLAPDGAMGIRSSKQPVQKQQGTSLQKDKPKIQFRKGAETPKKIQFRKSFKGINRSNDKDQSRER